MKIDHYALLWKSLTIQFPIKSHFQTASPYRGIFSKEFEGAQKFYGYYIVVILAHSDSGRVYFNISLQEKHLPIILAVCVLQNLAAYLL